MTFTQPSSGDMFVSADHDGRLLLIENAGAVEDVATTVGVSPGVRADVTVIDAPGGPVRFVGTIMFGRALVNQIARGAARPSQLLGRLGHGEAAPGKSAPWLLLEFTEADAEAATRYLATRSSSGFSSPGAGANTTVPAAPAAQPRQAALTEPPF